MQMLQKAFHRWLDKRIPAADNFALNHKTIFIFPARFGWLYLALCTLLFLLGTNYQNNLMLLLCYFLLAVFLVSLTASYSNFAKLTVSIGKIHQVYVNDEVQIPLWLNAQQNSSMVSSRMHGRISARFMGLSSGIDVDCDQLANPVALPLPCKKRGWHAIPRLTLSSFYPLGLFQCWTHLAFQSRVLVYPLPLVNNLSLQHRQSTGHDAQPAQKHSHDPSLQHDFSHLKAYQTGESLRHVAWKQVAKGRGMVSKQFTGQQQQVTWLELDLNVELELAISRLCFQVLELSRSNQVFGFVLGSYVLDPDSGESHRLHCLQALATYPSIAMEAN
jgi:uncharacterized protein (DUF58 family)